jgi:hypothetical protein
MKLSHFILVKKARLFTKTFFKTAFYGLDMDPEPNLESAPELEPELEPEQEQALTFSLKKVWSLAIP